MRIKILLIIIVVLLPLYVSVHFNFNEKSKILNKLQYNSKFIKCYSTLNPRKYASVIYAELFNNLDIIDELDEIRAEYGFNPSIGFAQIRISTFYWIENNSENCLITTSKNRDEILEKIKTDSVNILYSIEYIDMINKLFYRKYDKDASIKSLGFYYSYGIDYGKGKVDSSSINIVGKTAQEFYDSDLLVDIFPKD